MLALVDLVRGGTERARHTVSDAVLAGDVALGLLLVGLFAGLGGFALHGLGDVWMRKY